MHILGEYKLNETVIIKTKIIHTDDKSLIMEYQMWNEDRSHLSHFMVAVFAY